MKEKNQLPGDLTLPSSKEALAQVAEQETGTYPYSVYDYFKKPQQSRFKLSPKGSYLSYQEKDAYKKNHLWIKDISTGETRCILKEKEDLIRGYYWASETRILYFQDKGGDENDHVFAIDINGNNAQELTPFDGVKAIILNTLKDDDDHIIVSMNKDNRELFEPYKLNIHNGTLEKLFENKNPQNPIAGYQFDKDGVLRAYTQQKNGVDYVLYYRSDAQSEFQEVIQTNWQESFGIIGFDYQSDNSDEAYVISNMESNTTAIYHYDLKQKKTLKKLFSHDTFDVGGLARSRKRNYEIDGYYYEGEKTKFVPVSETAKKMTALFKERFKDLEVSIVSETDDETQKLLLVSSDCLYGTYYGYDVLTGDTKPLFDLMPQLTPSEMSPMQPIHFTSRDGLKIYGYLTLPKNRKSDEKVPLIVNPHGGPYGIRDHWTFNPEAQLFASRGYASLQINYRGSGGYGKDFYLAGSKQIGRKMLDDLEDGVQYAVTTGQIDASKIAIYGASYGGLATLGSLVKTPDLYACGVDYVGVSNLFTFTDAFPAYWRPFMKQFYEQWYDETDEAEKAIMKAVSPALNVEKIKRPLFVIQGANDPRVNIDESDQIVRNLRERGYDVPYMVKYDEGHGFHHEENCIELYQSMMGFFAKHLKDKTT